MLRLGICNLTGNAIKDGVNSNSNEIINLCSQFNQHYNYSVSCEVINTYNGVVNFNSIYVDEAIPSKYDAMLVMNSHANFFGGVKNEGVIKIYQFLSRLRCPIFYLFNDTNLIFNQLWGQIKGREWNTLPEEDVKVNTPFYVISQFNNLDNFILKKTSPHIPVLEVKHVDFGVWMLNHYKDKFRVNSREYDFIYGGSFRGGKRENKFKDFFFNREVKTAVYGSMKAKNFRALSDADVEPKWLGRVNSTDVIDINSKGFATIVVGEKNYNNNIETIRIYESILAGCIVFIDNDFDVMHKIFGGAFNYVKSGKEIDTKIKMLKDDKVLYNEIISNQIEYLDKKSKIDCISQILDFIREKL